MSRMLVLSLLVAAATTATLAACGEEDAKLLPGGTAEEITANLDTVQRLADEGDCAGAEAAALQVSEQVEGLTDVDPRLQRALRRGAQRLNEVVAECEEPEAELSPAIEPPEVEADDDDDEKEKEKRRRERDEDEDDGRGQNEGRGGGDGGRKEAPQPRPQPQDEGKGQDQGAEEEAPSGGLSPSAPAGEGE